MNVSDLLIFDPLKLPFNHHLSQVHSQLPLLNCDTGGEAEPLHGADHVLHEVVPYRVVNLTTKQALTMSESFWFSGTVYMFVTYDKRCKSRG